MQYPLSSRRLAEVKKELIATNEEKLKKMEARARRDGRQRGRDADTPSNSSKKPADMDLLFRLGLLNECPRCGFSMSSDEDQKLTPSEHLNSCNDKAAQAKHVEIISAREAADFKAKEKAANAFEISAEAAWRASGCVLGTLWTLPVNLIIKLCKNAGLIVVGDKVALIREYVKYAKSHKYLAIADKGITTSSSGPVDLTNIEDVDAYELPSNLHSLEADQLAAVCASFGLPGETADGKKSLIERLERQRFRGRELDAGLIPLSARLEDDSNGQRKRMLANRNVASAPKRIKM
jgi:hypothetical protein